MGNCIISKLGGSVNNDELLRLGDVRLVVDSLGDTYASNPDAHKIKLNFESLEKSPSMEIIGDGYFTDSTMTQNLGKELIFTSTNGTYYVSDGNYEIIVHTEYDLKLIDVTGVSSMHSVIIIDCDTMRGKLNGNGSIILTANRNLTGDPKNLLKNEGLTYLKLFRYSLKTIDLGWFSEPSLKCREHLYYFGVSGIFLIGKLSDFNNLPALTSVSLNLNSSATDPTTNTITGDLSDFNPLNDASKIIQFDIRSCNLVTGDISSLTRFYNIRYMNMSYSTQLTGKLDEFLDAIHNAGRVSGTMSVNIESTSITYNGGTLSGNHTVTFTTEGWTLT